MTVNAIRTRVALLVSFPWVGILSPRCALGYQSNRRSSLLPLAFWNVDDFVALQAVGGAEFLPLAAELFRAYAVTLQLSSLLADDLHLGCLVEETIL